MVKFTDATRKFDRYYIKMAETVSTASKCGRAKYGSVIVSSDSRVISTGYNGKPKNSCNDCICYRENITPNTPASTIIKHYKNNCCLHSETNALLFSNPVDRQRGTIYVSGVPCNDCALLIMQSGLARIVYQDVTTPEGHRGSSDEEFWKKYNVPIEVSKYVESTWKKFN